MKNVTPFFFVTVITAPWKLGESEILRPSHMIFCFFLVFKTKNRLFFFVFARAGCLHLLAQGVVGVLSVRPSLPFCCLRELEVEFWPSQGILSRCFNDMFNLQAIVFVACKPSKPHVTVYLFFVEC